jgi:hypothetical protein
LLPKKAPKGAKKAKAAREGSKTNKILDLLKRPCAISSNVRPFVLARIARILYKSVDRPGLNVLREGWRSHHVMCG